MIYFYNNSTTNYLMMQDLGRMVSEARQVHDLRKQIFSLRDNLRGSTIFSMFYWSVIGDDPAHPPRMIQATQSGAFSTELWDPSLLNYEPIPTRKFENENFTYVVICALYLLFQEIYPNVYDFPNRTIRQLNHGATVDLIMKKSSVGMPISAAYIPPVPEFPANAAQNSAMNSGANQPSVAGEGRFCTMCGTKNPAGARFCSKCGNRMVE